MLCVTGVASAQEADRYRLRVPSAEEYLAAIPDVMNFVISDENPMRYVIGLRAGVQAAISKEWQTYYSGEIVQISLIDAIFDLVTSFPTPESKALWGRAVVDSFLHMEGIPFDYKQSASADFGNFHITLSPHDFDADGQPEWVIHVTHSIFNYSPNYDQMFVVQQQVDGLRFVDHPLPWLGGNLGYGWHNQMEEQYFGDITGDGLPEWAIALGGAGGNGTTLGELVILQWRGGSLARITPPFEFGDDTTLHYVAGAGGGRPLFPYGVEVGFSDTDGNGVIDVVVTQTHPDSLGCNPLETRVFAWDEASQIVRLTHQDWVYEATPACAARLEEEQHTQVTTQTPVPTEATIVTDNTRDSADLFPTETPAPEIALLMRGATLYAEAQAAEAAGDDKRALAAYVEIVTLAPESPWGKLAALHLEPVE